MKARRKYQKPPIIEALCEFNFEPGQLWDGTLPGLLYNEVKEDFPKRQPETIVQLGIQIMGQNPPGSAAVPAPSIAAPQAFTRLRFLSEDERAMVQIGPDLLAINRLRPYSSWNDFKPLVLRVLTKYQKVARPKGIRRIGVRYINRIEIPLSEVKVDDYLVAFPNLPDALPQRINVWVQRSEIPFDSEGTLIIQTGSVREAGLSGIAFLLDLDFVISGESFALEVADDKIEMAHEKVELAFEECITDKSRKLFEEVH